MSGTTASEIVVHSQPDVEALVQAAVSVLTNDMQIAHQDGSSLSNLHVTSADHNTVQLLVDANTGIQERLYMCTDCNLAFYGEHGEQEWHWHLRQHKAFKCELCSEGFGDKDSLKAHIRTHSMQMPYVCEKCGSAYSLKSNLTQHMKTHEEVVYSCTDCSITFKSEASFQKHMRCHSGEPFSIFQCEVCNKTFAHQKNLVQHQKIHQNRGRQFKCPECPASYSYKCHLTRHLMIHTGDKPYKCKFCGKAFNRNAHLVRHRKIHLEGEKEFKCHQCGFAFYEKSDLQRHIRSHEGNRPYKCDFCPQTFVWKRYLYKHLISLHKEEGKVFCQKCCIAFDSNEELAQHEASHDKKALTHSCSVCGEEFHFKYRLDEHMYQHTGEKAHACDQCTERFVSRKELDRHKTVHAQALHFSCNTCEKTFTALNELQDHLKLHIGSHNKYSCAICSQTFRWKSQLTNHMVVHSNDHDFTCSICYKEFKRKRDLIRHVKVFHDTKPPFKCLECKTDFHSAINLHRHKSETHWKKADEIDSLFSCSKCSGMFRMKKDLDHHVNKVHPFRPYICKLCSKRFTLQKFLITHFEQKHPEEVMIEDLNYMIRQPKEQAPAEQATNNMDTFANCNVAEDNEMDAKQNTEEISNEMDNTEGDFHEIHIVSENGSERERSTQTEKADEDDSLVLDSDQPMSEAITLAQLSQQVPDEGIFPIFLQENLASNEETGTEQHHPVQQISLQNGSHLVTGNIRSQSTRQPQIFTIPAHQVLSLEGSSLMAKPPVITQVPITVHQHQPARPGQAPQIRVIRQQVQRSPETGQPRQPTIRSIKIIPRYPNDPNVLRMVSVASSPPIIIENRSLLQSAGSQPTTVVSSETLQVMNVNDVELIPCENV
ncbi:zinc finger protein 271-like [Dreissena polymorpha]|uniref:C2H2-type domain-containing protein n=1 Tax=Dreissena polymorpha TaxID=45954 RepID=A0A9D4CM51_DREPO|nr:zinc finger protein 271-like [Dreissena polymorpha]KAH3727517.1 hypothetical protein DPMN_053456 [Dreissena polymorpha]